ncbi:MAG: tRNA-splicing endonuclease subunit sen54 [Caeruleum heppii]|nr:MAG: tRNA-splicing endonuclease subunit sen54 [Caeruleum heppii]
MADLDERPPPASSQPGEDADPTADADAEALDLADEAQDFRFLSSLTSKSTLPRRGTKDFEPVPQLQHQQSLLAASRAAMHDALSVTRTHPPKTRLVGIWHAREQRCWVPKLAGAGTAFKTVGRMDREGRLWLVGEEMLFLLERGGMDVLWAKERDDDDDEGLPMSLQAAYAEVIGSEEEYDGRISLEQYIVYASLKRCGYAVLRAPAPSTDEQSRYDQSAAVSTKTTVGGEGKGLLAWLFEKLFVSKPRDPPPLGPLVGKGLYRSYEEIHRLLTIIPTSSSSSSSHPSSPPPHPSTTTTTPLSIAYHIHKPTPHFRKSSPGPPDYYISILSLTSSSTSSHLPSSTQLSHLLSQTPLSPPDPSKMKSNYARLKHGRRRVVLAVVDQGVVSWLRIGEGLFEEEALWGGIDRRVKGGGRGGGRGGKGGGRGRRGGRGGGGRGGRGRGR